jgi:oxygen-independent coproporphyrinogen-3 oxidase
MEVAGMSFEFGFENSDYEVDSIYIGGGTPTLFGPHRISEILDAVYAKYRMSDDVEITIEANPGTADYEDFKGYISAGINRLSIGAQSFDNRRLRWLGRIHDSKDIVRVYSDARDAGFANINFDLMFGLPKQSRDAWERDLLRAINLDPEHISFYSLTPEEGTPVYDELTIGHTSALSDLDDRIMYHSSIEFLQAAGYKHYEISNAAKPGFESRHNLKYWSLAEYIGLGLGAHSYAEGARFANTVSLSDYLSANSPDSFGEFVHVNSENDNIAEYIFLGLRKTEGINLVTFSILFGKDFWQLYGEETNKLIERGLLEHEGSILRLTPLGLDLSNQVFSEYV